MVEKLKISKARIFDISALYQAKKINLGAKKNGKSYSDQYQYVPALTAIEKLARYNNGEEDKVSFEADDIKHLSSVANECSKKVKDNFPVFDENSLDKANTDASELKENIEKLLNKK